MKKDKSSFPTKRIWTGCIIIVIVYLLILALLYSIVNNVQGENHLWIFLLVWGILLILSLIAYILYQIIQYRKSKHEKK